MNDQRVNVDVLLKIIGRLTVERDLALEQLQQMAERLNAADAKKEKPE
jgi:hypothetical protein